MQKKPNWFLDTSDLILVRGHHKPHEWQYEGITDCCSEQGCWVKQKEGAFGVCDCKDNAQHFCVHIPLNIETPGKRALWTITDGEF